MIHLIYLAFLICFSVFVHLEGGFYPFSGLLGMISYIVIADYSKWLCNWLRSRKYDDR